MREFPGKERVAGTAIRTLRRVWPRPDLTFFLGQQGRLGNQLFQIAGTWALATDLGVGVVLPADWAYRPYFSLPDAWFGGKIQVLRARKATDYVIDIPWPWREYLQDLALWGDRQADVQRLLQPSPHALAEAESRYGDLLALPSKTSLHVRRGDYLDPEMPQRPCPPSYYSQALEIVLADDPTTQVVVFSDDVLWCRRELPVQDAIFVEGNPDWLDLTLMTRCEHHICANSTFSWWGAFLSDDPSPIVPWLLDTVPELFRRIHPPHWRELVVTR
jgi:hypothetical protein